MKRDYAFGVTKYIKHRLLEKGEAARILQRQYMPSDDEQSILDDEMTDPIGDDLHSPLKGIVHRYPDRLLLLPLHICSVYCRFCFRREQVGSGVLTTKELEAALAYIKGQSEVREVILSGGDPLILSPRQLGFILESLEAMTHIDVIRLHSRLPVADPAGINEELLSVLERVEKGLFLVIHANHATELEHDDVRLACRRLVRGGVALLGQSVLLRGVNDSPDALRDLWRAMVRLRIKPYYLHHLDRARGTSHFRVSLAEGRAMVDGLRGRLSGLAQANYVMETPEGSGKSPLAPSWVSEQGDGVFIIRDYKGGTHDYSDSNN